MNVWQNTAVSDDAAQPSAYVYLDGSMCSYDANSGLENYKKCVGAAEFIYDSFGGLPTAYISNDADSTYIKVIDHEELKRFLENDIHRFIKLAIKNNDTTWNGYTVTPIDHLVINDSIMSIVIISNVDYDDTHRAGDDISDVVKFIGSSPFDFIQNGYKTTRERIWTNEMTSGGVRGYTYEPIICYCSEIQNVQTKFFEPHFDLLFVQSPKQSGMYNFELKIKLSQKTLTCKFSMQF